MASDPRRALIVMACVVAVGVGGVALPATSYGDVPGSDVDVVGSSNEAGEDGNPDPKETETDTQTQTDTQTETDPRERTDTPGGADGGDSGDSNANGLDLGPVLVVVGVVVLGLAAAGIRHTTVESKVFSVGAAGRLGSLPSITIPNPFRAIAARTAAVTLSAPATAGRLGHALQEAVVGVGSAVGSAAAALGRAGRIQASAMGSLASAISGVGLGLSTSLSDLTPRFGRDDLREARPAASGGGEEGSDEDVTTRLSVVDAWTEMRRLVPISNAAARTPAEVARAAIDQGLPRGPVMRLTEIFREVTYGRADPNGIRETAVDALRSVRNAIRGES
jgi:hypothetical protein